MRTSVFASLGGSLSTFLLGVPIAGAARADGEPVPLECRSVLSHTVPSTVCRPFVGDEVPVRVLFRKMPAWSGNSDLLVIDMCKYSPEGFRLVEDQLVVSADQKLPPEDPRIQPVSCVRRYCTEKSNAFSLSLNAIPIPMGWVAVRLWVGFHYQHFQVACKTLQVACETLEETLS